MFYAGLRVSDDLLNYDYYISRRGRFCMASKCNRSFSDSPSDMYVDRHITNPSHQSPILSLIVCIVFSVMSKLLTQHVRDRCL